MTETTQKDNTLDELRDAINNAPESIDAELKKTYDDSVFTPNNWFDCFNTNATYVQGYFELARSRNQITGEEAERAQAKLDDLLSEIGKLKKENPNKQVEVSEEKKEELLQMINILGE